MKGIFQKNRLPILGADGQWASVYVPDPDHPEQLISGLLVELDLDAGDALVRVGKNGPLQMDVGYSISTVYCKIPVGEEVDILVRELC